MKRKQILALTLAATAYAWMPATTVAAERGSAQWCETKRKQAESLDVESEKPKVGEKVVKLLTPAAKKAQDDYREYCH